MKTRELKKVNVLECKLCGSPIDRSETVDNSKIYKPSFERLKAASVRRSAHKSRGDRMQYARNLVQEYTKIH